MPLYTFYRVCQTVRFINEGLLKHEKSPFVSLEKTSQICIVLLLVLLVSRTLSFLYILGAVLKYSNQIVA